MAVDCAPPVFADLYPQNIKYYLVFIFNKAAFPGH